MTRDPFIGAVEEIVGSANVLSAGDDIAPYLREWRGRFSGQAAAVIRPATVEEVAGVVRIARDYRRPIVPQGGNTGLVGGSVPFDNQSVVLSLGRLNRVRAIDPAGYTITVEAGCILQSIQTIAADHDRLFPLSLGAEGTCQIGGNLSTNAGGLTTIRFGNARDLVLGLEVVLPDGRILNELSALRKDNTGYDLKHLFIGAEGTLGIITAAVLKLFPRPAEVETAYFAVPSPEAAVEMYTLLRTATGDQLYAMELMCRQGLDFAFEHIDQARDPLGEVHPWYVLAQATSGTATGALAANMEATLAEGFESGLVLDAVVASSEDQRNRLWFLREAIVEAQRMVGGSIKHDVSLPVAAVPTFIERANTAVTALIPGIRPVPFGHLGDGNMHYNLTQPLRADKAAYLARWDEVNRLVHDIVVDLGGSISAEHGIGTFKRESLAHYKDPVALDMMRMLKQTLDPENLMNPGKVLLDALQEPAGNNRYRAPAFTSR